MYMYMYACPPTLHVTRATRALPISRRRYSSSRSATRCGATVKKYAELLRDAGMYSMASVEYRMFDGMNHGL